MHSHWGTGHGSWSKVNINVILQFWAPRSILMPIDSGILRALPHLTFVIAIKLLNLCYSVYKKIGMV